MVGSTRSSTRASLKDEVQPTLSRSPVCCACKAQDELTHLFIRHRDGPIWTPITDSLEMQFNQGEPQLYTLQGKLAGSCRSFSHTEGATPADIISVIPTTRIEALQLYRLRLMAVASPVGTLISSRLCKRVLIV